MAGPQVLQNRPMDAKSSLRLAVHIRHIVFKSLFVYLAKLYSQCYWLGILHLSIQGVLLPDFGLQANEAMITLHKAAKCPQMVFQAPRQALCP